MKKKVLLILGLVLALMLTACGGTEKKAEAPKAEAPKTEAPKEEPKKEEPKAPAAGKALIVYSNSLSDGRGDWLKAKAKEAGFDLEFVEAGGGAIADRLIAEKNNPVCDVVFGPNEMEFIRLEKADVLEKYEPKWLSEIEPQFIESKTGLYYPLVKQATLIVYNEAKVSKDSAPKDWTELWQNSKYHKKYEVANNLGGATVRKIIAGILVRHTDPKGDLGISEQGWKEVAAYFNNGVKAIKGEDLYAHFASGSVDFGPMWSSGVATREKQYNIKSGIIMPSVGVPVSIEQVGIVKGSKQQDRAKAFIDWFGSADTQVAWSKEFTSIPVNKVAFAKVDPAIQAFDKSIIQQQMDWNFVVENIDKWCEKIELQILK